MSGSSPYRLPVSVPSSSSIDTSTSRQTSWPSGSVNQSINQSALNHQTSSANQQAQFLANHLATVRAASQLQPQLSNAFRPNAFYETYLQTLNNQRLRGLMMPQQPAQLQQRLMPPPSASTTTSDHAPTFGHSRSHSESDSIGARQWSQNTGLRLPFDLHRLQQVASTSTAQPNPISSTSTIVTPTTVASITASTGSGSHPSYPQHFMRDTPVQLANGQLRRVQELSTEDFIQSANASPIMRMDSSTVVKIDEKTDDHVQLCFSVGEQKVQVSVEATVEHPFYVIGQGWSSHSPSRSSALYGLTCQRLQVGDICISLTHRDATTETAGGTTEAAVADTKPPTTTFTVDSQLTNATSSAQSNSSPTTTTASNSPIRVDSPRTPPNGDVNVDETPPKSPTATDRGPTSPATATTGEPQRKRAREESGS